MLNPLKVTIHLATPPLLHRFTTLDSILISLHYEGVYTIKDPASDRELSFIEKKNGTFSGSIWFVEGDETVLPYTDILKRNLSHDWFEMIFGGSPFEYYHQISSGSGQYKALLNCYERIITDKVYFYIKADPDKLKTLLNKMKYLGKKGKYGWGLVKKVEIEDAPDKGFYLNSFTPSKPLPVRTWKGEVDTDRVAYYRATPPYWLKSGIEPCYMPHTALFEMVDEKPARGKVVIPEETITPSMLMGRHFELPKKVAEKMKKHLTQGRCVFCGRDVSEGVSANRIKDVASGKFTDFQELQEGNVICLDCAKSLKALDEVYRKAGMAVFYEDEWAMARKVSRASHPEDWKRYNGDEWGQYKELINAFLKGDKLPYHVGWRLSSNRQHIFYKAGCKATISSLMPVVCRDDSNTLYIDRQLLDEAVVEARKLLEDYARVTGREATKTLLTSKTISKTIGLPPIRNKAKENAELMERLHGFFRKYDIGIRSMLHFFLN